MNKSIPSITQEFEQARETYEERAIRYEQGLTNQFAALPMAMFIDQKAGKLTHMDVCLYCYLLSAQRQNTYLFWSIESLALASGISTTGIKTSLRRLGQCNHIQRKRTQGTAHTVCLTIAESDQHSTWIRIKGVKGMPTARKARQYQQTSSAARPTEPRANRTQRYEDDWTPDSREDIRPECQL